MFNPCSVALYYNDTLCTIMVLFNPLKLFWAPVDCKEGVLDMATVYCLKKSDEYYAAVSQNENKYNNQMKKSFTATFTATDKLSCSDGTLISSVYAMDGIHDCVNKDDEFQCQIYFPLVFCASISQDTCTRLHNSYTCS